MAKGIANGFPFAAVVTTPEIAASLTKALFFNTFGGNPIGCAAAKAVLEVRTSLFLLSSLASCENSYKLELKNTLNI